jgi:Zn-dependent membrane protease YugP
MAAKNVTFVKVSETEYNATGKCVLLPTETYTTASFPASALFAYNQGAYIQDALSMLSVDDREFIVSGISPKGWEAMGPEED